MNEEKEKNSFGILHSLKKLIFEDSPIQETATTPAPQADSVPPPIPSSAATKNPPVNLANNISNTPATDVKQMKVKVLEMLEKLNEPGVDFFEVWNAAAEMGGVTESNLRAAFTSLKYVDKTLTKEKLQTTGQRYATELRSVIEKETSLKQQQKQQIEQGLVNEKANLTSEIAQLEKEIEALRSNLQQKQQALQQIHSKYAPQLQDIDQKIAVGNAAVTEVVTDIQKALLLINNL
ncbi:hypothetical protein LX64_01349 [Chitinophaga skermanii]|uniref:Uncharacterized protein n=1 Tax=Chitinophaga skermanii TaxID=331697 RepID=A0A327QXK1_9BACT|nr:hypothetical protein [Chitinophaga skermanii]RAJ08695.1 hypothetical protein LX64_01349 [Chitinophaga skermanii]